MSDTTTVGEAKEALLERLKARAVKEELAAGNVQGPSFRGSEWGADIIAGHRQHAADLRTIISSYKEREAQIETFEAEEGAISVLYASEHVKRKAAEANVRALTDALERVHRNFHLLVKGRPVRDVAETDAEVRQVLAALLSSSERGRPDSNPGSGGEP